MVGSPPAYQGGASPEHQAWRIIGEILFWLHRSKETSPSERISELWTELDGELLLAASDVIYQLKRSRWQIVDNTSQAFDLASLFPDQMRRIIDACLPYGGPLPSVFSYGDGRDPNFRSFLITTLGQVGDQTSIPILQALVDDANFGKEAIQAIKKIQRTK